MKEPVRVIKDTARDPPPHPDPQRVFIQGRDECQIIFTIVMETGNRIHPPQAQTQNNTLISPNVFFFLSGGVELEGVKRWR